ncbi:MAG: hypothetical protein QM598_00245 [Protaetiibacter sp.]
MTETNDPAAVPDSAADPGLAPAPASAPEEPRLPRPRIRTGAVLWGLVLVALAGFVLWTVATPARRADALDTLLTLPPLGWAVGIVVAVGATITLIALAAVIRRLQGRATTRE